MDNIKYIVTIRECGPVECSCGGVIPRIKGDARAYLVHSQSDVNDIIKSELEDGVPLADIKVFVVTEVTRPFVQEFKK